MRVKVSRRMKRASVTRTSHTAVRTRPNNRIERTAFRRKEAMRGQGSAPGFGNRLFLPCVSQEPHEINVHDVLDVLLLVSSRGQQFRQPLQIDDGLEVGWCLLRSERAVEITSDSAMQRT